MFYVYEWYIIETGEIIYVGKGCNLRYKAKKHNKFFNDMIKRNKCDSRIVREFEKEEEAFEYEYDRVNELRALGQCVCNIYNGGYGGKRDWWTAEIRQRYSHNNVMKSEAQRKRMSEENPMKNHSVAEKTNAQKRRKVIVGNIIYESIKEAKKALNASYSNIITWSKKGITPDGKTCTIEKQKMFRTHKAHGNQQPSRGEYR